MRMCVCERARERENRVDECLIKRHELRLRSIWPRLTRMMIVWQTKAKRLEKARGRARESKSREYERTQKRTSERKRKFVSNGERIFLFTVH